jgi:hypothetical protein
MAPLKAYSIFICTFYLFLLLVGHHAPLVSHLRRVLDCYYPSHVLALAQPQQLYIKLIAGNNTAGYNGDNRVATTAQLNFPNTGNVWGDSNGVLYIADFSNSRVRSVSLQGIITTIAGGALVLSLLISLSFLVFRFTFSRSFIASLLSFLL